MADRHRSILCFIAALFSSAPACADKIWVGGYQHDVTLAQEKFETGQDIKAGWIGDPLKPLHPVGRPSPHVLVSKSLNGGTNYVAAGLNWTFGSRVYVRPGIGMAVNDGPSRIYRNGRRRSGISCDFPTRAGLGLANR